MQNLHGVWALRRNRLHLPFEDRRCPDATETALQLEEEPLENPTPVPGVYEGAFL